MSTGSNKGETSPNSAFKLKFLAVAQEFSN